MTVRTYQVALTATIEVDDATVKSAMLGFELRDGLDGPDMDEAVVFEAQQQMLGHVEQMTPAHLMRMYLVNGYLVRASPALTELVERGLPGADVRIIGIDVEVDGERLSGS